MKSGWQTVLSAVESYNLVPRVEEDEDGMVQPEKPGCWLEVEPNLVLMEGEEI